MHLIKIPKTQKTEITTGKKIYIYIYIKKIMKEIKEQGVLKMATFVSFALEAKLVSS